MTHLQKIFFFLFLLSLSLHGFAQDTKISGKHHRTIDSLKKLLLTAKEDTNKVNALNELAWEMKNLIALVALNVFFCFKPYYLMNNKNTVS